MKKCLHLFFAAFSALLCFVFSPQASANCEFAALCDAPPGQCATTCNGGLPCVIGWMIEAPGVCKNNYWYCDCSDGSVCPGGNYPGFVGQPCGKVEHTCSDGRECSTNGDCPSGGSCDGVRKACSNGDACTTAADCDPYYTDGHCRTYPGVCSTNGSMCTSNSDCPSPTDGVCHPSFPGVCLNDCRQDEKCPTEGEYLCYGETKWDRCCSPGGCGDGVCSVSAGETAATCPADCGPGAFCGDDLCNGSETCQNCPLDCLCGPECGNGNCEPGEGCTNCPEDCACDSLCGNGTCDGGETCSTCAKDCGECVICGDGICNGSETCNICSLDCGECTGPYCGDGGCFGFENCANCEVDCGVCPELTTWFQVAGGNLYAGAEDGTAVRAHIPIDTCIEPDCIPYLMIADETGAEDSVGVAITGGGEVDTDGWTTQGEEDIEAIGSTTTRVRENYFYFYREYSLGLYPEEDFAQTYNDAHKPTDPRPYYFHDGDMTVQSRWEVGEDESIVIFVNGNLTISDPDDLGQMMTVEPGGFLAFIVSGDITIDSTVGNEDMENTTSNLEGIYIADGILSVQSTGEQNDKRFVGEGTFVGWTTINLERNLGEANNLTTPGEYFIFRPDLTENMPHKMKRSQMIWQETN